MRHKDTKRGRTNNATFETYVAFFDAQNRLPKGSYLYLVDSHGNILGSSIKNEEYFHNCNYNYNSNNQTTICEPLPYSRESTITESLQIIKPDIKTHGMNYKNHEWHNISLITYDYDSSDCELAKVAVSKFQSINNILSNDDLTYDYIVIAYTNEYTHRLYVARVSSIIVVLITSAIVALITSGITFVHKKYRAKQTKLMLHRNRGKTNESIFMNDFTVHKNTQNNDNNSNENIYNSDGNLKTMEKKDEKLKDSTDTFLSFPTFRTKFWRADSGLNFFVCVFFGNVCCVLCAVYCVLCLCLFEGF